jgi:hypothetical protein
MFSSAPSRPRGADGWRFARPAIRLPGIINPRSKQSPSGAKDIRTIGDVVNAWQDVVQQVGGAGLNLGTHFDTPPGVQP